MSPNHWVSKRTDKQQWAVKQEGAQRASSLHKTQEEAFQRAKNKTILEGGGEVLIKNTQGRIREKNTYGKKDPYPPRG
ncbi:MAG: DUF2188 domain-containing protein [Planctomycetia bacterium]|nr:DUF2188 domain-containing protein [Planctomycetia bacterium]